MSFLGDLLIEIHVIGVKQHLFGSSGQRHRSCGSDTASGDSHDRARSDPRAGDLCRNFIAPNFTLSVTHSGQQLRGSRCGRGHDSCANGSLARGSAKRNGQENPAASRDVVEVVDGVLRSQPAVTAAPRLGMPSGGTSFVTVVQTADFRESDHVALRVCSNVRKAPSLNPASIATRSPAPGLSAPASCRKKPRGRIPDARGERCSGERQTPERYVLLTSRGRGRDAPRRFDQGDTCCDRRAEE